MNGSNIQPLEYHNVKLNTLHTWCSESNSTEKLTKNKLQVHTTVLGAVESRSMLRDLSMSCSAFMSPQRCLTRLDSKVAVQRYDNLVATYC